MVQHLQGCPQGEVPLLLSLPSSLETDHDSRRLRCTRCGQNGATIGCYVDSCKV